MFDRHPEEDHIRARIARSAESVIEKFAVQARPRPRKPKRNLGDRRRDSIWEGALNAVIHELGIKHINVNGVPCFRTAEDRDRVHEAAVLQWHAKWDDVENRRYRPTQPPQTVLPATNEVKPKSSAPFILSPILPDPIPTEDQLKLFSVASTGDPRLDRFKAETKWRDVLIERDENAFLVPFVSWIRPAIDYNAYLKTPLWKGIKRKVLAKAGRKCACCLQRATEVHHRDYRPRVLAGEDLSPLVPICRSCHDLIENERNKGWHSGESKLAELVNTENQRLAGAGGQQ
ncbi:MULTISPECIES: HNH endonuclease [Microvirga]|uniref:HNH endonuclease n=1 Tax=Microvirga TaxID=186650 RepID=UPI0021C6DA8E|nr:MULTISPECIES: HNH endonuclease signature motif containing protein [unclassified Microvirga]